MVKKSEIVGIKTSMHKGVELVSLVWNDGPGCVEEYEWVDILGLLDDSRPIKRIRIPHMPRKLKKEFKKLTKKEWPLDIFTYNLHGSKIRKHVRRLQMEPKKNRIYPFFIDGKN